MHIIGHFPPPVNASPLEVPLFLGVKADRREGDRRFPFSPQERGILRPNEGIFET
jgi:hypothetical protein